MPKAGRKSKTVNVRSINSRVKDLGVLSKEELEWQKGYFLMG